MSINDSDAERDLSLLTSMLEDKLITSDQYIESKLRIMAKANLTMEDVHKLDARRQARKLHEKKFITELQLQLIYDQIEYPPYGNPPTGDAYETSSYLFRLKEPCCSDEKIKKEMNQGDLWDRYKEVQCKTCNRIWVVNESPLNTFTWVRKINILKGNQR